MDFYNGSRGTLMNINPEQWRWVVGYENLYYVSDIGRVYSLYSNRCLFPQECNGYFRVALSLNGKISVFFVHRLVAFAFIENDNIEHKTVVNHKDGDRHNNKVINLEWVTPSDNLQHSREILNNKGGGRAIIQYNMEGTYVKTFPSAAEAARSINIGTTGGSSIIRACKDKSKTFKGFYWRYETEFQIITDLSVGRVVSEFPAYIAFPDGNIYSKHLKRYLTIQESKNGYSFVFMKCNEHKRMFLVHRVIALTFIPNPENKPEVNHKNSIRNDNRVDNLEWVTRSENSIHIVKSGNSHAKPVVEITETGEIIREFASIKEAAKISGVSTDSVARRCYGIQRSIKGKFFRFSDK